MKLLIRLRFWWHKKIKTPFLLWWYEKEMLLLINAFMDEWKYKTGIGYTPEQLTAITAAWGWSEKKTKRIIRFLVLRGIVIDKAENSKVMRRGNKLIRTGKKFYYTLNEEILK